MKKRIANSGGAKEPLLFYRVVSSAEVKWMLRAGGRLRRVGRGHRRRRLSKPSAGSLEAGQAPDAVQGWSYDWCNNPAK